MPVTCGVDLIEVERVKKALARGERFRTRVYTPDEVRYCEDRGAGKWRSYAARFAAKEAAVKALGTGLGGGAVWHEIEVGVDEQGRPELHFHGRTLRLAQGLGVTGCSVSLSHCDHYAVATVVLERA